MKSLRRLLLLPLLLGTCHLALAAQRPNIVFIFSDDHATNAISAYGSRLAETAPTPNLDRIANEGALFKNSFCANSICGPSRANILTGKHSHINGFLNNNRARFDGTQTTFPKILQKSGYQTAIVGKWHLVSDPTGFDYWEILPGQGSYYNPDLIQMEGGKKRYTGYCTDIITDRAIDWLDNGRDKDKPFVLMCQHKAPHRNWSPAERHLDLFDDIEFPEPDNLFDDYQGGRSKTLAENAMSIRHHFYWGHDMKFHGDSEFPDHFLNGIRNGEYRRMNDDQKAAWDKVYAPKNAKLIADIKSGKLDEKAITRWKYQRYMRDYLRCIRAVDENVGRVLDYLDKNNLAENTVVIYSSDQGFYLGEHGWYDKRWMFEESLEMPFLVRWPGVVKPGTRPEALIQNIDYAPTFLDITGTPVPVSAKFQGRSILPALKDTSKVPDGWRDAIYYTYYGENTHNVAPHDGVRTAAHKLMYFPGTDEWNLIDLVDDPDEMRSVHADPAYASVLAEMTERYHALRKQYGVSSATVPAHRFDQGWWSDRHKEKTALAKKGGYDLTFIGDSITHAFERKGGAGHATWAKHYAPRNAINLGYGGDRTQHVLYRLQRGEWQNVRPKVAVLMIGTNNTGHVQQDPDETTQGIRQILDLIADRSPETKTLLLGVFPRGATPEDKLRKINVAINERIAKFHDGDKVHFLDISDKFLTADGTLSKDIMPDLLHPNAKGYQIWADAIEPTLSKLGGWDPIK